MKTANPGFYDLHQNFAARDPVHRQIQVVKEKIVAAQTSVKQYRQMDDSLYKTHCFEKAARLSPIPGHWVSTSYTLRIMDTKQTSSLYTAWEVRADGHGRKTRIRSCFGPSHFSH